MAFIKLLTKPFAKNAPNKKLILIMTYTDLKISVARSYAMKTNGWLISPTNGGHVTPY
ncbi:protein of unknown function [Vibrio tapetis subsp. tapetis]|uniref:Uncharacterized protein n=1 Tax=Vibrio tapetis subsp. tapetis TaxID=1671868 RepID=A0A2N8ZJ17_9VIBR|nr:protein of unknown function [Vibrio tapetis subsp. tapetis]